MTQNWTIVDFRGNRSGYRCGYCGSTHGKVSHGMWAHTMTVQDYQALIDRGWRRSGKYCYKPTMNETCCPQYTIRCGALNFQASKSQKKVIKRFNRLITQGMGEALEKQRESKDYAGTNEDVGPEVPLNEQVEIQASSSKVSLEEIVNKCDVSVIKEGDKEQHDNGARMEKVAEADLKAKDSPEASTQLQTCDMKEERVKKQPIKGLGPDISKPPPQKAKEFRKERWRMKHGLSGHSATQNTIKSKCQHKSVESLLGEIPQEAKHKLEIKLVRSAPCSDDFDASFEESYQVYKKYQMSIHGDPPDKPSPKQFRNFLVESPLQPYYTEKEGSFKEGFGSFHQQYLIDGKIVAVGVIDILPTCVSSVYLYYDPDYFFLSLGTYTALKEAAFVRSLHTMEPSIKYYYMGFYIHSCPKMKYKGQYTPSFLLCPESYNWIPIETCRPKLDASKYARFDDADSVDPNESFELGNLSVLHQRQVMPYHFYQMLNPDEEEEDQEEIQQYAKVVGAECAQSILLYRS